MTPADVDCFLDAVLAFDLDMQREELRARETLPAPASGLRDVAEPGTLEQARERMRSSRSAEGRTFYRLEVMRLEREMRAKGAA